MALALSLTLAGCTTVSLTQPAPVVSIRPASEAAAQSQRVAEYKADGVVYRAQAELNPDTAQWTLAIEEQTGAGTPKLVAVNTGLAPQFVQSPSQTVSVRELVFDGSRLNLIFSWSLNEADFTERLDRLGFELVDGQWRWVEHAQAKAYRAEPVYKVRVRDWLTEQTLECARGGLFDCSLGESTVSPLDSGRPRALSLMPNIISQNLD